MPQYNQPGRLDALSQKKIAENVGQFFLIYLQRSSVMNVQSIIGCKYLQNKVHNCIPPILANNFTLEVIKQIDGHFESIKHLMKRSDFQKKLSLVLKAVLHPKITALDLSWNWNYVAYFVIELIGSLNELKVLKVTKGNPFKIKYVGMLHEERWTNSLVTNLELQRNLDTLCIMYSGNDTILEIVCKSNIHLKILDVRNSQNVTDKCIGHILKCSQLEELNLSGTSVTNDGYMTLLQSFSQDSANLMKFFGFDCYTPRQLISIGKELKNLVKVSVVMKTMFVSLSLLISLQDMEVLKVKYLKFMKLKTLLLTNGRQLLKLKLDTRLMENIDLKLIAEQCPRLQSLKILGDTYATSSDDCKKFPNLTSIIIQTLELYYTGLAGHQVQQVNSNAIEYLLRRCPNLTRLSLCTGKEFYEDNLGNVFANNSMEKLQELTISTFSESLQPRVLNSIIEHCKNLNKFTVYAHLQDIKQLQKSFPGVNFIPFRFRTLSMF